MMLMSEPESKWAMKPFQGSELRLWFTVPPNRFHRLMQTWFFGFKWEKQ